MGVQGGISAASAANAVRAFRAALESAALDLAKSGTIAMGKDLIPRIDGHAINPRRVDTAETRDGWAWAVEQATGIPVGSTSAAKYAYGTAGTVGSHARVVLTHEAPQAELVEYGAPNMRPGYHLRDATRTADALAERLADPVVAAAMRAA